MDRTAYNELADGYDFEEIENDEYYLGELGEGYNQAIPFNHSGRNAWSEFDEMEDFEDDTGSVGIYACFSD